MSDMHPAITTFFDQLSSQMQELLAGVHSDGTTVSWTASGRQLAGDLVWWSCGVSIDPGAFVFAGASQESWTTLGGAFDAASDDRFENDFGGVVKSIQQTAQERFGAEVVCEAPGQAEEPVDRVAAADFEIAFRDGGVKITFVLTQGLIEALGAEPDADPFPFGDPSNPVTRLLSIEVPVSVSLGRAEMRMKDLLALSSGSIVELEQGLGDRVEIRANNCVIAKGEMVAVDGNYGVRILEMVNNGFGAAAGVTNETAKRR
jgi:flagellar motor switch protein FliN/FliY